MRAFIVVLILSIILVIAIDILSNKTFNKVCESPKVSQQRVLTEFANDLRVNDVRVVKLTEECILIQRKITGNARVSDKWTNIAVSCTGPDK